MPREALRMRNQRTWKCRCPECSPSNRETNEDEVEGGQGTRLRPERVWECSVFILRNWTPWAWEEQWVVLLTGHVWAVSGRGLELAWDGEQGQNSGTMKDGSDGGTLTKWKEYKMTPVLVAAALEGWSKCLLRHLPEQPEEQVWDCSEGAGRDQVAKTSVSWTSYIRGLC